MNRFWMACGLCCLALLLAAVPQSNPQSRPQSQPAQSQPGKSIDPATLAKARKLLMAMGQLDSSKALLQRTLNGIRNDTNAPKGFADELAKVVKAEDLFAARVAVCARVVPVQDMEALTAFFSSEVGKRWTAGRARFVAESNKEVREWFRKQGLAVRLKLEAQQKNKKK